MKRLIALTVFATATMGAFAQKAMTAPPGGKVISDELIGIFFEDISSAADGGLYAELVQNGSFEYAPSDRDGWGPGTAWRALRPGHSLGYMEPRMDNGIHPNNPTYMRLHTERAKEYYDYRGWKGFGIQNDGFDGFSLKEGAIRVALVEQPRQQGFRPADPKILADTTFTVNSTSWKKYEYELTSAAESKNAVLQILVLNTGDLDIDMVSLMPQDTYKGHGLRKDLAQALADLHPKFMRFPGGCVVHGGGEGFWDTYRWKTTVGPKFCEDLGMEPLPILPCGVSCQGTNGGWGMRDQAQDVVPMSEMDEWVNEALDLIEWANGDVNTKWGRIRAEAGHPKPFGLKYLGLGNEERISPEFIERFKYIYERVTKAHPEIVIVGTAGPGSHPGNRDFEAGWKLADELGMPILDEHYYEPRNYFLNTRQYDKYPRDRKTKVYLGEYAAKDKKLIDALAEGLYLLHVERNGDVVAMTSYAPLFARKNATNWNPDLIYFDNDRPFLTCSYYVQQFFGQSSGQYYYGDCVTFDGDAAGVVQPVENSPYGQSVVLNTKTRQLFVKICNAGETAKKANIDLSRFKSMKKVMTKTVLSGQPNDENNFDVQPIAPKSETIKAQKKMTLDIAPYSFVMLQVAL